MGLAAAVFVVAFLSAFYFTWRKSNKQGVSLMESYFPAIILEHDHSSGGRRFVYPWHVAI